MSGGRSKALWSHTSAVLAMLANVNRDPKKGKAFTSADFNPHARKQEARVRANMSVLKDVFVKPGKAGGKRRDSCVPGCS